MATPRKYARVVYNTKMDSFDIQIKTREGWGLEVSYPCVPGGRSGAQDYIHWTILDKLGQLRYLGYIISFLPEISEEEVI